MNELPDCMYDYRPDNLEDSKKYIGDCHVCGQEIYEGDDYRYRNGALMHDDCVDEYENELEEDEGYE